MNPYVFEEFGDIESIYNCEDNDVMDLPWLYDNQKSKILDKTLNNAKEVMVKQIVIEGLLSIQAGENPRVIEEKLKSFVAPRDRDIADEGGDVNG